MFEPTWQRIAGGRRSRWGGVRCGCGGPVGGGGELRSDAGMTEEDPGSPCCPLSCTGPDSSSGRCQSQTRTGRWSRH